MVGRFTGRAGLEPGAPLLFAACENNCAARLQAVRGDTEAVYGEVVAVMDKLATNGITHIAIMTNSRSKTGAAKAGGTAK